MVRQLSREISGESGGSIIEDKTGLTSNYDFTLQWTLDPPANADPAKETDPAGPSVSTAIQEQLGLRLESQKAPVETLVIDRVEKPDVG